MTNDNLGNTYSYDAEGRPMTVAGVQLAHDAFGRALELNNSGTYTQMVYAPSGWRHAVMSGSSLVKWLDPMVAGMVAVHNGDGTGYYQHADWLGSSRLAVTGGGTVPYDRAYAPYGEPYDETASTNRNFTGQTEDTTAGIYDFLFRQQSQSQGRWLVPDPAGLAAVDLTNPQTWNRYGYVANNPLSYVDPIGLQTCVGSPEGGTGYCFPDTSPGLGNGVGGPSWRGPIPVLSSQHPKTQIVRNDNGDTDIIDTPVIDVTVTAGDETVDTVEIGTISQLSRLDCAAAVGNRLSLVSRARIQGSNVMGKAGQYLLGNTFSDLNDFRHTFMNASNAAPVYLFLLLNGTRLGLPGGGTVGGGVLGTAQDLALKAAFVNLGKQAASKAAFYVGTAKAAYDFGTFMYGYSFVCH